MKLISLIYEITLSFPKEETYGLVSQLRRASVSISSNIAEGSARSGSADRRRFYEISRSSLVEVDTQLEIALNLNYINGKYLTELGELMNHSFALLSNLISKT